MMASPTINAPFLCVRCAAHQRTCCQTSEIAVTLGDVRRIAEHIGQHTAQSNTEAVVDICELRAPSDPVYLHHPDDPIWLKTVIRPDGTRRVLKRKENGDCQFLGEQGCVLPTEVRPLICRIYPYDYNEQGLAERLASGCPIELLRPDETLLSALDMHRCEAERWHAQLYAEVREEPHYAQGTDQAHVTD